MQLKAGGRSSIISKPGNERQWARSMTPSDLRRSAASHQAIGHAFSAPAPELSPITSRARPRSSSRYPSSDCSPSVGKFSMYSFRRSDACFVAEWNWRTKSTDDADEVYLHRHGDIGLAHSCFALIKKGMNGENNIGYFKELPRNLQSIMGP